MTVTYMGQVRFNNWSTSAIDRIAPLYVRGAGANHGGTRRVELGSKELVPSSLATTKGLGFMKLDKQTHEPVVVGEDGILFRVFNTHGSATESNALAAAIESVSATEVGILTSFDRFEGNVTVPLADALERVGLVRLAGFVRGKVHGPSDPTSQRAYAAIFGGTNGSVRTTEARESFASPSADVNGAVLSTFLVDGGFGAHEPTNRLIASDPNVETPAVSVDKVGNVGIGTNAPDKTLSVAGSVGVSGTVHANTYAGPLSKTITFQDGEGTTVGTFNNTANVTVPVGSGINASVDASGAPEYNAFVPKDGAFYGGTTDPDVQSTVRLNYQGPLHVSEYHGALSKTITFKDGEGTTVATFDNTDDVDLTVGSGGINASIDNEGAPEYNAFVPKDGAFYGGTIDPDPESDKRLNYQGSLHASEYRGPLVGPDVTAQTLTCGTATVTEMFTSDRLVTDTVEGTSAVFTDEVEALNFTAVSDARFKTNVATIDHALDLVRNMRGVRFEWSDGRNPRVHVGLLAQEVQPLVPEVVQQTRDGTYGVSYGNLVAVLIEAIKTQDERIQHLETHLGI